MQRGYSKMIIELKIKRKGDYWVFDDKEKGIKDEPFVEGTDKLIDKIIPREDWDKEHTIIASDKDIGDFHPRIYSTLVDFDKETNWSTYSCSGFGEHRLCPVLLQYFNPPPKTIFFSIV